MTDAVYAASLRRQHDLWQAETQVMYDALQLKQGSIVADLGCGPGFTCVELAERVGLSGRVIAIDSEPGLLQILRGQQVPNIEICEQDLDQLSADFHCDAIFMRWVAYQIARLPQLIRTLKSCLPVGGRILIFDYFSQRYIFCPSNPLFESFVDIMEAYWSQRKCDVHVQQKLPNLLASEGFRVIDIRPSLKCARPKSELWNWPDWPHLAERFVSQGLLQKQDKEAFLQKWREFEARPEAFFLTPLMLLIVAERQR